MIINENDEGICIVLLKNVILMFSSLISRSHHNYASIHHLIKLFWGQE